jgi:hypothetical protein
MTRSSPCGRKQTARTRYSYILGFSNFTSIRIDQQHPSHQIKDRALMIARVATSSIGCHACTRFPRKTLGRGEEDSLPEFKSRRRELTAKPFGISKRKPAQKRFKFQNSKALTTFFFPPSCTSCVLSSSVSCPKRSAAS